jgi:predicted permease
MIISKKENRREFAMALFFQNGIFFPLAIFAGMFGNNSYLLVLLFIFTIFYPAFFFSTGQLFFGKKFNLKENWRKIVHPVLVTTTIAIILRMGGFEIYIPDFVKNIFTLLGGMTLPLIMIILGGNIYIDFKKTGKIQILEIIKFVSVKNIIFPIIFLGILIFLRPSFDIAIIIILQAAVPPITAVPLLTERYGGNRFIVNQFIISSFISSLITIPIIVSIFTIYFPLK